MAGPTFSRNVNGWLFCKSGINDESIVQRSNLHAYLSTGATAATKKRTFCFILLTFNL